MLPAGNAFPNTVQEAVGLLCFKGSLWAHIQPEVQVNLSVRIFREIVLKALLKSRRIISTALAYVFPVSEDFEE